VVKCPLLNWKVGCSATEWINALGPERPLGKSVHLNCPGKKHNSGFGLPPIAVIKIVKKHVCFERKSVFSCSKIVHWYLQQTSIQKYLSKRMLSQKRIKQCMMIKFGYWAGIFRSFSNKISPTAPFWVMLLDISHCLLAKHICIIFVVIRNLHPVKRLVTSYCVFLPYADCAI